MQTLNELKNKIDQKEARIGVIGLGYVGLPVAAVFANAGFEVIGVEQREERVSKINAGQSPMVGKEPGLAELLAEVVERGWLVASTKFSDLSDADVILIAVETPIDQDRAPRFEALKSALTSLGPVMKKGALVINESTVAPGTTERVIRPVLEESSKLRVNEDFQLGHCPERVMPGKLLKNLRTVSRVCGGYSPEAAQVMVALYRHIVEADLDPSDCVTAELVKTAENAYRDVNIAFANELALICEAVGGNVWDVRQLVNKSPGRNVLMPGAGVGGHCIPKDPWLLAYGAEGSEVPIRLISAARAVNDGMPQHMVDLTIEALLAVGKNVSGAKILVMGYAYLEGSDDARNSPSASFVEIIQEKGAVAIIHDPYIVPYQGDVLDLAKGCEAAVVMVRHPDYENLDMKDLVRKLLHPVIIDGRNLIDRDRFVDAGAEITIFGTRGPVL